MLDSDKATRGKISIIARMGVKYIPFELDELAQEWVHKRSGLEEITAIDLISMVLGGRAKLPHRPWKNRYLKRIDSEEQMKLQLDFTHSFLCCEETGENQNLMLCLIENGKDHELKLLTETASLLHPVVRKIPVDEMSLIDLKELIEQGKINPDSLIVKRLKHWFAGRVELWGLAYG